MRKTRVLACVLACVLGAAGAASAQTPPPAPPPPPPLTSEPPPAGEPAATPPPAAATFVPVAAPFVPPWRYQISLSPPFGASGLPLGLGNGLQVYSPEEGRSVTGLGLQAELGYLYTPMIEPSLAMSVLRFEQSSSSFTQLALTPSLKLNYWASPHVALFGQPFLGIMVLDASAGTTGDTEVFSDLGAFGGIEVLVSSWGVRVWTGVEWVHGDFNSTSSNLISFPIRWGLFGYFLLSYRSRSGFTSRSPGKKARARRALGIRSLA